MSTDRDALLAAVFATPDDDAPRMVFADWLDENGEPGVARFIREHIRLFRLEEAGRLEAEAPGLASELGTLLWANGRQLTAGLPGSHGHFGGPFVTRYTDLGASLKFEFRRGFVESAEMDAGNWLAHADAILAAHPVREVRLTTWPTIYGRSDDGRVYRPTLDTTGVILTSGPGPQIAIGVLSDRWPSVKTWHLPEPPARRPLPDLMTPAAHAIVRDALHRAGAAVRRFADARRPARPALTGLPVDAWNDLIDRLRSHRPR